MTNKLINVKANDQKIVLNYENEDILLFIITPEIIRVFQDRRLSNLLCK